MTNLLLFFAAVFIFLLSVALAIYLNKRRLIKKIDERWGKFHVSYYDLETSKLYTRFNKQRDLKNIYTVDDETWKDLNLDELFEVLNRTITPIGSQILYDMLKHPGTSSDELNRREKILELFSNNTSLRRDIQISLLGLAKVPAKYLAYSLWTPIPEKPKYSFVFYLLSALSVWFAVLSVIGIIHWGFAILIYITNLIVYRF
ncbi:MAG: hypothetical protein Q8S39_00055, partial [Ignavibacteria bacterium]|nr:hypothetical protein [Ignavibacteria bacterium]